MEESSEEDERGKGEVYERSVDIDMVDSNFSFGQAPARHIDLEEKEEGGEQRSSELSRSLLGRSSLASKSTLRRRRSTQLSSLLGIREQPGRWYTVRKCFSSNWLWPVVVLCVSIFSLLIGTSCLIGTLNWFHSCPVVFLPSGSLLPVAFLLLVVYLYQPSASVQQQDEFYSDALLEELLAGENILDAYTVTTHGTPLRENGHVIVFLSGVGGLPETWQPQVDSIASAGFHALTIQMPGSGSLSAVKFSLPRAERVVRRVLDHEVFPCSEQEMMLTEDSMHLEGLQGSFHSQNSPTQGVVRKVVLVGWGLSSHVAMYLSSARRLGNGYLAGVALLGSPCLPSLSSRWFQSLKYCAFRVPWIAQAARVAEYSGLDADVKRVVSMDDLHPEARADWGDSFLSHQSSLLSACAEFYGPVLVLSSDKTYLERMQRLWGAADETNAGANVDCICIRGLESAGFRSFPKHEPQVYSKYLVQFSSGAFI